MRIVIMLAALLLSVLSAFGADTIRVDRLRNEDIRYMYRGWSEPVGSCAIDVINEIRDFDSGQFWSVVLDENKPEIHFYKWDGTNIMICQKNGLREIGTGKHGSQKFDNLISN